MTHGEKVLAMMALELLWSAHVAHWCMHDGMGLPLGPRLAVDELLVVQARAFSFRDCLSPADDEALHSRVTHLLELIDQLLVDLGAQQDTAPDVLARARAELVQRWDERFAPAVLPQPQKE